MSEPGPVIELEPKTPFRWSIVIAIVILWLVLLGLGVYLKSRVLLMLWPAILFVLVVYLAICTFFIFRKRK